MDRQCQFDESCSTGSSHYRKVISHIFGRNKKCTVNIPDAVWIYYCRKHYQRARYRNDEWPFTQCRLALDTIANMQAWGGVDSFNLTLRRRERLPPPPPPPPPTTTTTTTSPSSKKSPKNIPRPVPDWLHDCVGPNKSFDEIRQVIHGLRAHFLSLVQNNQEPFFPDIEILPNLRRSSKKPRDATTN
ncbi:ORP1 [Trichophyton equinum CBS 127.97]|uniref:ORP1 n=1 Tax=Trichophyton equinum (strain ATCC MYA-4606 / CBS 127.97) TaxID=559882 RepID=F2PLA8_TRIEC|nr:ORP1 [Trichophyton equinum CBS 127.97]